MSLRQRIKHWYLEYTEFKWRIGVAEYNPETILDVRSRLKIHWIKKFPSGSWFADPFILSETADSIQILAEEYVYADRKGRISKLVVNRSTWEIERIVPVIEIQTHLSFPVYFREAGKVYIYPESSRSGVLTLYEYDETAEVATPVKVLSKHQLADAVIINLDGRSYIMATSAPDDNGNILDLYPCDGDPSARPEKQIPFKTFAARNAGVPFFVNGRLIRPAQDCTRHYGSCVVLQELINENGNISFKEIRRLRSPLLNYHEAFHTFNVFEDRLAAVDAQGFRYGVFPQVIYHVREFFR